MARPKRRLGRLAGIFVALSLSAGWLVGPSAAAADAKLPAWDGGVNLYRQGTFTTQKSWLWCTAADVQIIRNIVERDNDHATGSQRRYFEWMRARNRYDLPLSAGVDPQGWTAGLRHFVDSRYRLVASKTFDAALKSAVTNLRRTNLPVAVAVSHGNHGWVLTGFTATADPARTASFKVTSVRVVGPLFGLQSKNGYDMRPNTKLTVAQFRGFFTPWKYAPKKMIWDGRYVSIQPIPAKAAPVASPKPAKPSPTVAPSPALTALPSPSPTPSPLISPLPSTTASPSAIVVAALTSPVAAGTATLASSVPTSSPGPPTGLLALVAGIVAVMLLGWRVASRRQWRPGGGER